MQVQDEEITEDDLRLIHERESSIRQLEVSLRRPCQFTYLENAREENSINIWQFGEVSSVEFRITPV